MRNANKFSLDLHRADECVMRIAYAAAAIRW